MKFKSSLLLIAAIISISGFAQKVNYTDNFKQGNLLMLEKNYSLALTFFQKAYSIDSLNSNINYKIGWCYLESQDDKYKAMPYLLKASKNVSHSYNADDAKEKRAPESLYKLLGIACRLDGKFEESDNYFGKFRDIVGKKNLEIAADLERQIEINSNALAYSKNDGKTKVLNAGSVINTPFAEYSPIISSDGTMLVFTSRREGNIGGEKGEDGQYNEDVYYSKKNEDETWGQPKSISNYINSNDNESAICLSSDGKQVIIAKEVPGNGEELYFSSFDGVGWGSLFPMSGINSRANEFGGSLSADGKTFYFSTDRKEGGVGGYDIWKSEKFSTGKWDIPSNLGSAINSKEDEINPFISNDGRTLFFSSKGNSTMGGYDVFKSTLDETGKWSTPENLRSPINTCDDEMKYSQTSDGSYVFFSSARKGGLGESDIYYISNKKPEIPIKVKVNILFQSQGSMPSSLKSSIIDGSNALSIKDTTLTNLTDKYTVLLQSDKIEKKYTLNFESVGFQTVNELITLEAKTKEREIEKTIFLNPIKPLIITPDLIILQGNVIEHSGKPISGASIIVKDNVTESLINTFYTSTDSGKYSFSLPSGKNYNLTFEADGYLFQSQNISLPKQSKSVTHINSVILERLEVGATMVLNNIFFDKGKASLSMESNLEIEKVVKLMTKYPHIKIEVDGHTDNKGNAAANLLLSQNRSQSVVNELIANKIAPDRLIPKGFGSTMPKEPNALPNGQPNLKGMQANRRVELKILENK